MTRPNEPARRVLGKGLSALLPVRAPETQPETAQSSAMVPIGQIDPNPVQPRTVFQPAALQELANSIHENGIIQPLIVQRRGDRYQLVAGERRWRAAKLAGIDEVPVVIRDIADQQLLQIALIENIQREDLNPIETAQALDRLGRELGLNHEDIGKRTGKDRSTISNLIRLLRLPTTVQILLAEHRLSMGHARALLGLPTADLQQQLAEKIAAEGLSVRQVERMVQQMTKPREASDVPDTKAEKVQDPNIRAAAQEMEHALGTRVQIVEKTSQTGKIEIEYYSQDDLDRIYHLIIGNGEK